MGAEDISEKTSIVTGDTFSGRMRAVDEAPPALVVLIGPQGYSGKQFPLTNPEYIIGRSAECSISLDDKSVSRSHARLMVVGQEVTICDLGSANKTVVNGQTLNPMSPYQLKNNDQVKMGNVIIKFLEKGNLESVANKELNEKATKDALTGAHSKNALLERGPELMKRAEMLGEELSVIVLDLDFFKKINDRFGHSAGDYVLKEMARIISTKMVRSHDFFARYGGEEFVILLSGTPLRAASEVAERVRATVENAAFEVENKKIPVTVSFGVAGRRPAETQWDELFKRADEALYYSKQNGRNRVTVAT